MKARELKITRIGNSRGVRLPAETLSRYRIGEAVLMEEKSEGILLKPLGSKPEKLSWEDTAREMAVDQEDWSDWDAALADGLDNVQWDESSAVADRKAQYKTGAQPAKKK